jgi:hypothetical protein
VGSEFNNRKPRRLNTLKQSIAKLHVTSDIARLTAQPMFVANPEAGNMFFDVPALAGATLSMFHDNSC